MRKVFKWIRGTYVVEPNFIKFAALQLQLTQLQSQPSLHGKQSLGFFFSNNWGFSLIIQGFFFSF